MTKAWNLLATAITIGLAPGGAALAACESFSATVPIDARQFEYSDVNGDGKVSPGDMVLGRNMLFNAANEEIGRLFVIVTISEVVDQTVASRFDLKQVVALRDGGIFVSEKAQRRLDVGKIIAGEEFEKDNMSDALNSSRATMPINGGTGSYTGAAGSLSFAFTDGVGKFEVTASCK